MIPMEQWRPITNDYCKGGGGLPFKFDPPTWQRNGQSYSCSFCGSMSTEELLDCLDATPRPHLDLADSRVKIYVQRYHHAGECPVPGKVGNVTTHPCSCDSAGDGYRGGPIKFYSRHLYDGGRSEGEVRAILNRLNTYIREDFQKLLPTPPPC